MPLDRQAKRILGMLAASGGPPRRADFTAPRLREAMVQLARAFDVPDAEIGSVERLDLPRAQGALPVRVYSPRTLAEGEPSAGLIYFHGGAGMFCSLDTHEGLCRLLAQASGCRVFSVDYRLAPEHPFPAAVEDAHFATEWICANAAELDLDRTRIAIGGDSFGGTLSAVVCQEAKSRPGVQLALQVLLCPVTDLSSQSPSWKQYGQGHIIDRITLDWATEGYAPGMDLKDTRISPLQARDLSGLPPAHIHTAEFDPLRDEGRAYADRLASAGVSVRYVCHAGMVHHFYCMAGAISYAQQAIREAGAAIAEALAPQ
jgi:acetyl esterase/lipase